MDVVLKAEGLRFLDILRYPPIEVEARKATFITGDSGTGKSSLLKLFNGVYSPSGGRIWFKGQDIQNLDTVQLRRKVLLTGQSVFLFDATIRENYEMFYGYRELPPPDDDEIKRCLAMCSADFAPDTCCTSLSGGERQRVYVALFLSLHPEVLMLDEPTSALDAANASRMLSGIKQHCQKEGITLVVVSHDTTMVDEFADARIVLERGEDGCSKPV